MTLKQSLEEYDLRKIAVFVTFILIFIAAVSGVTVGFYYYSKYQSAITLPSNTETATREAETLVAKIGKLIHLPDNEEPVVATVSDMEKLKDKPFFKDAKVGDKVLLYTKNKRAVLYDVQNNKIIEVGPLIIPSTSSADIAGISTSTSSSEVTDLPTATPSFFRVALYNGSGKDETLQAFEKKLQNTFPMVKIVERRTQLNYNYDKTLIINLSEKESSDIQRMATRLNMGITDDLPEGETKPENAEVLIIIGLDQNQ